MQTQTNRWKKMVTLWTPVDEHGGRHRAFEFVPGEGGMTIFTDMRGIRSQLQKKEVWKEKRKAFSQCDVVQAN